MNIRFELDEIYNGPNSEPLLEEMIHQASYRSNTLGLPNICPEEKIEKISCDELLIYLSSHFDPSRMILVGVNVDHGQFVDLAKQYFVEAETSWSGVPQRDIDQSISQYTSSDVMVRIMLVSPFLWLYTVHRTTVHRTTVHRTTVHRTEERDF